MGLLDADANASFEPLRAVSISQEVEVETSEAVLPSENLQKSNSLFKPQLKSQKSLWDGPSENTLINAIEAVTLQTQPTVVYEKVGRGTWPVLMPENSYRRFWQAGMCFPLMWTATLMPYRLCFVELRPDMDEARRLSTIPQGDVDGWVILSAIVDWWFVMDLGLQFFFAYYNENGTLVKKPSDIWKSYLQGWFVLDLFACLPSELFVLVTNSADSATANKSTRLPRLIKIGRLLRLMRLMKFSKVSRFLQEHPALARFLQSRVIHVLKYLLLLIFLAHLLGCAWYLLAGFDVSGSWIARRPGLLHAPPASHWLHSIYFVITVFTTVGFGDIHALANHEVIFVMGIMLLGAIVNSIIVSEVISAVTRVDDVNSEIRNRRGAFEGYMQAGGVNDARLESRVQMLIEYRTKDRFGTKGGRVDDWYSVWEVVRDMPDDMQQRLAAEAFGGALALNHFFTLARSDYSVCDVCIRAYSLSVLCGRGETV